MMMFEFYIILKNVSHWHLKKSKKSKKTSVIFFLFISGRLGCMYCDVISRLQKKFMEICAQHMQMKDVTFNPLNTRPHQNVVW